MIKRILTSSFVFSLILIIFTQITCDSTEPPNIKSPRDYTWIADTVFGQYSSQTLMSSIWGSSENDVYMCGHSAGPGGGFWHYDGKEWEEIDLLKEINWHALYTSVHGTSAQNVWIVGYNGSYSGGHIPFVANYNGSKWIKHEIDFESMIFDVFVKDRNDVWICGSNGIVAHYDKIYFKWNIDTIKNPHSDYENFHLRNIAYDGKNVFIQSTLSSNYSDGSYFYIFKQNNTGWEILDSMSKEIYYYEFSVHNLYYSSFGELFSIGPMLYKYQGNSNWSLELSSSFTWIYSMFNRGKKNIMAVATGEVYHNSGSNWAEIEELRTEKYDYQDIWMNDKTVFIVGQLNNRKTIIWKGE